MLRDDILARKINSIDNIHCNDNISLYLKKVSILKILVHVHFKSYLISFF